MTLQFFSAAEAEILAVLTERMVGTESSDGRKRRYSGRSSISDHISAVMAIDAFVTGLPLDMQVRIRRALHLFQWCPILFVGKLGAFTRLSSHDADTYIRSWAESRLGLRRRLFRSLRDMIFLGYYCESATDVY